MARIIELKGSGDFQRGPTSIDGKGLAIVLEAADQDEAYALAEAFFPNPMGLIPRGSITIAELGGGVYSVDCEYKSGIPPTTPSSSAGDSPSSSRPPGGGGSSTSELGPEYSFSTGGATKRIFHNVYNIHRLAKAGDNAADYQGLIGVNAKTARFEGCEVIAPSADFTITRRFTHLTLGWFRSMLDAVACTNATAFVGMEPGEVLFKGADGNYKHGDDNPWTVTGRFGYARNRTLVNVGPDIQIPDCEGWHYIWVAYAEAVDAGVVANGAAMPCIIERPRWVYVEKVYFDAELNELGIA